MKITEEQVTIIREAIRIIKSEKYIELTVTVFDEADAYSCGYPNKHISGDEIIDYLSEPIEFFAKQHGVSKESYQRYVELGKLGWRCEHMTKKGTQCYNVDSPLGVEHFIPSGRLGCRVHQSSAWRYDCADKTK